MTAKRQPTSTIAGSVQGQETLQEHAHIWTSVRLKAIRGAGKQTHKSRYVRGVEFSWLASQSACIINHHLSCCVSQWARTTNCMIGQQDIIKRCTLRLWLVVVGLWFCSRWWFVVRGSLNGKRWKTWHMGCWRSVCSSGEEITRPEGESYEDKPFTKLQHAERDANGQPDRRACPLTRGPSSYESRAHTAKVFSLFFYFVCKVMAR